MKRLALVVIASLACLVGAPGAIGQDELDGEIRSWFERRLDEEAGRLERDLRLEVARTAGASPLEALPANRRRRARRLADVLAALPVEDLRGTGLDTARSAPATLADVPFGAGAARVLAVGEQHDNPAHHRLQARLLRLLHASDPRIAIGMEMFPRPTQGHLDDFLAWRTTEAEFLAAVDWEKTWGFDWAMYRPLVLFARDHGLPVLALNAPRDVVRLVSRGGLDSLSAEDRARIARDIDTSNAAHRARYDRMMGGHPHGDPENMYQAMCVWDDTMAETAADFLESHPRWRVLVVAGNGHVEHGDGIPDRIVGRVGGSRVTIVPRQVGADETVDPLDLLTDPPGDYVFFTD